MAFAQAARQPHGFTVLELLYAIAIAAVIFGLGTPSLQNAVMNARRTASVNAFVASVQFARSESQTRGATIVLCQSSNQTTCTQQEDFASGWIVYEETSGAQPIQREDNEMLLRTNLPAMRGHISSNRTAFEFRPFPRRSTNGTINFCDARGAGNERRVVISYTGRPRIVEPQTPANGSACRSDA